MSKGRGPGMRRKTKLERGRVLPIAFAGVIGYLLGGWHATSLRSPEISAAQTVALRFPAHWDNATLAATAPNAAVASTQMLDSAQLALLSPEPMVARAVAAPLVPQADEGAPPQADPRTPEHTAPAGAADLSLPPQSPPLALQVAPQSMPPAASTQPAREAKTLAVVARRRPVERPGYVLNDAQIASVKERLNLTPDQERMWPAVESALRNMAYIRAQQAQSRGGVPADAAQTAAVEPEAVQGLKSAAVPLIMSFNAEQKEEVRNLAHVMGLDQLTSQF